MTTASERRDAVFTALSTWAAEHPHEARGGWVPDFALTAGQRRTADALAKRGELEREETTRRDEQTRRWKWGSVREVRHVVRTVVRYRIPPLNLAAHIPRLR